MHDKEGKKNMDKVIKSGPVESPEINFKSEKEYENFVKPVNHPPEPNERVKKAMKQYQNQKENHKCDK